MCSAECNGLKWRQHKQIIKKDTEAPSPYIPWNSTSAEKNSTVSRIKSEISWSSGNDVASEPIGEISTKFIFKLNTVHNYSECCFKFWKKKFFEELCCSGLVYSWILFCSTFRRHMCASSGVISQAVKWTVCLEAPRVIITGE